MEQLSEIHHLPERNERHHGRSGGSRTGEVESRSGDCTSRATAEGLLMLKRLLEVGNQVLRRQDSTTTKRLHNWKFLPSLQEQTSDDRAGRAFWNDSQEQLCGNVDCMIVFCTWEQGKWWWVLEKDKKSGSWKAVSRHPNFAWKGWKQGRPVSGGNKQRKSEFKQKARERSDNEMKWNKYLLTECCWAEKLKEGPIFSTIQSGW